MTEAFVCDAIRTPIGRYGGGLSTIRPDDMLAFVLRALASRNPMLDMAAVDDVFIGCANQAGEDNRNVARMAALLAGIPETVPGTTINRLCGSGMDAVGSAARAIKSGEISLALAGGVESMSRSPFVMPKATTAFSRSISVEDTTLGWRFVNALMHAQYGTDSMPETAENVAEEFNINREDQDLFAARSQERAAKAMRAGRFTKEILPVEIPQPKGDLRIFDADEHLRPETTVEKLKKLPAPFRVGGSVTAGNASGVNDGAAALIIASEDAAARHGLTPRARITGMATAGIAPRIMGLGPAPAAHKLMGYTGTKITDYDVVELNEAFAAQALAVLRNIGLPDDAQHVNPNGGAIALGHPLGMSGARLVLTAIQELQEHGLKTALCAMCIGVGQGIAMGLERV